MLSLKEIYFMETCKSIRIAVNLGRLFIFFRLKKYKKRKKAEETSASLAREETSVGGRVSTREWVEVRFRVKRV